ncbi:MAG: methyltransferase [Candidatus Peribacteria bacterium]|nr:MAG: methyltransferase [Candidatus Peribacteria bacterium]
MDIVDINPDALLSWEKNIQDERANFVIGDVHEILGEADQVYDLVISNPPYVPRPQSIDDNPYE